MSDLGLGRILSLAGLSSDVAESEDNTCKNCGCDMTNPDAGCECSHPTNEGCDCDCGQDPCVCDESANEAVGDFADPMMDLCDELGCDTDHPVFAELIRYLSADQIEDFVADFRRHNDMNHPGEDGDYGDDDQNFSEAEIDENAFNQAAAAAARAGKDTFEFGGKTHKTTMKKDTAHKIDEEPEEFEETFEAVDVEEEIVSEAPTMDTTQLVTMLKNSGFTAEAIEEKLTEWANTPEGVGEVEPTVHGGEDNYAFAQSVNLSLKRYLDAEDMKVQVSEHTVKDLKAAYLESKKNK